MTTFEGPPVADLTMPEPPPGAYVLAGDPPNEVVYVREDEPDGTPSWWALTGEEDGPYSWDEVLLDEASKDSPDPAMRTVVRLYRHGEVVASVEAGVDLAVQRMSARLGGSP